MTNLEALQANISDAHGVVLSENHRRKALIDVGVFPDDEYGNAVLIDRATLKLYDMILAGANFSEGSLSYNINIEGLKALRAELAEGLGITPERRPTIDNAPRW